MTPDSSCYLPIYPLTCCGRCGPNRPPFVGHLAGACRSKSYHHMACHPPPRGSDSIHSEARGTARSLQPVGGPRAAAAQHSGARRGHPTRYVIVNEHMPTRKLLHSATRIPRHYLMAEPADILELYGRPHISHLSQEWDEEHLKGKTKTQGHRFYTDRQAHFHIKNHGSTDKGRHNNPRRYGKTMQDNGEEEEDTDHLGSKFHSSVTEEGGLQLYLVRQSPVRSKHLKKTKFRARQETQTESDSASVDSSTDQQNSSPDQYIQVIHNRPEAHPSKMPQNRSKTSFHLNMTQSHDLVCSKV